MAAQPSERPLWAVTLQYEQGIAGGLTVSWPNRSSIPDDYQQTGVLLGEDLDRQWLNQQMYLVGKWVEHLDERYVTGDIHLTVSAEDAATISTRLGGTWVQRGTQALGTITAKIWEKTA